MSSATVYDVVEQRLRALWTATPLVFENEDWPSPKPQAFVYVELFGDVFDQASIGGGEPKSNLWREEGQLLMHVLVPAGTGSRQSREHTEALADLFCGEEIGGVVFESASLGATDPGERAGQYYQMTCSVAWYRDK